MAKKRADNPRTGKKAGDPTFKPKCCQSFKNKMQESCAISKNENDAFIKKQKHRNTKRANHKKKKGKPDPKPPYTVRNMTWKDKHCKKLMFDYENPVEIKKNVEKALDEFDAIVKEIKEKYTPENILQKAAEGIDEAGKNLDECVKMHKDNKVNMGICMLAVRFIETAKTAVDVVEIAGKYEEYKVFVEKLHKETKKIEPLLEKTKKISDLNIELEKASTKEVKDKLKEKIQVEEDALRTKKDEIYDDIAKEIAGDDCIKAKRCQLEPYTGNSDIDKPIKNHNRSQPMDKIFALHKRGGCCPGQRAHHIIPQTKLLGCKDYVKNGKFHQTAPTVCVEGGLTSGTHGTLHANTDTATRQILYKKGSYEHISLKSENLDAVIEASAAAYIKTFKDSKCDKECIKEQLQEHYKQFKACTFAAKDKSGKVIETKDNTEEETRK